jgi:hypothetical protein
MFLVKKFISPAEPATQAPTLFSAGWLNAKAGMVPDKITGSSFAKSEPVYRTREA